MSLQIPNDPNLERRVLSGLIKHPKIWFETPISTFLKDDDFFDEQNNVHKTIFRVCRNLLKDDVELDPVIISSYCKKNNITTSIGDIYDFIDTMSLSAPNEKGLVSSVKELKIVTLRRKLFLSYREAAKEAFNYKGNDPLELLKNTDKELNKEIDIFLGKNEPENILADIYDFAEELGNQEENQKMILSPWNMFNRAYGGFRVGDAYCFAGRPENNKSTVLMYAAYAAANLIEDNFYENEPIPTLYLDTEMNAFDQKTRLAACIADINAYYIECGSWNRNEEMRDRVRTALPKVQNSKQSLDFSYIPRYSAEELVNYTRRWYLKKFSKNPDKKGIIVFDYLKMSGHELQKSDPRLNIAHKLDCIKDFVKEETNCTLLFGAQRNRSGAGRDAVDDDTSIAESDHIQQLSSWVGLIKKKTEEELSEQPRELFGSHCLINAKKRKMGPDTKFFNSVKINNKYVKNWINLDFQNFKMIEKGDGRDVAAYFDMEEKEKDKKGIDNNSDKGIL